MPWVWSVGSDWPRTFLRLGRTTGPERNRQRPGAGAARSIRALKNLGAGISRAPGKVPEPVLPPRATPRASSPEIAASVAASKTAPKKPLPSEYSYTDEEYTVEPEESPERPPGQLDARPSLPRKGKAGAGTEVKSTASGSQRVKEELPEREEEKRESRKEKKRSRERSERRQDKKEKKKDKKDREEPRKRRRKRGGRKHKRLSRLAEQPYLEVHRRLPASVLEERPKL